uniref:Uncharacterized protein n=1 Tax=Aegilops tauschii subsp. strangulata TaxID=200361 RepID=A0A453JHI4_AEGTS
MRTGLTLVLLMAVCLLVLASADAGQSCNSKILFPAACDPGHCEQLCVASALLQGAPCRPRQGDAPCFTSQSACVPDGCNCTVCFVN